MLRRDLSDLEENGTVGDWCIFDTPIGPHMFLLFPIREEDAKLGDWWPFSKSAKQGDIVSLPLCQGTKDPNRWLWDGNKEAPTLSPSINVIGRWHGFLRAGKIETV